MEFYFSTCIIPVFLVFTGKENFNLVLHFIQRIQSVMVVGDQSEYFFYIFQFINFNFRNTKLKHPRCQGATRRNHLVLIYKNNHCLHPLVSPFFLYLLLFCTPLVDGRSQPRNMSPSSLPINSLPLKPPNLSQEGKKLQNFQSHNHIIPF